jgi:O-antigen/teichoic acid export membrane protein
MIVINKILSGDARTVKANKNIIASGIIKVADTLVYLLLVPLTLGYLNAYEYGIWLTLNSMLAWINSFDIGLGNGLRNKLAAALAEGDKEKARSYVSTTFFMLLFLISIIYIVLVVSVNFIDWYSVLNVSRDSVGNLLEVVHVSLFFFCVNFVLKFIGNIYQGLQLPAFNYLISFLGHVLSLVVIFVFTKLVLPGTLFWVAAIYSAVPPIVYLVAYPVTFRILYRYLSPSFIYFKKEYLKDLLSLSVIFFILQIASIVLFALSNLLISNLFGPDQVTPYNIAYRYFSLVPMVFNMLVTPMWSASTDAFTKQDYDWIKKSHKNVLLMIIVFGLLLVLMFFLSDLFYHIWIGNEVHVSTEISAFMGIYILIYIWSLSYSYFLNGIGRLKLQMICTISAAIIFYPCCHFLGTRLGVVGIIMGMCVVNLPGAIINTIQFNKVLSRKDSGIWSK